jgi:hypothetical protein
MKKLFTFLVSLLVTASVYSQTYKVNTFYAELGGYVIKTDGTHGVVVAMQDQGAAPWSDAKAMVNNASKHDANGAKFNDWRLPTKDELNLIFMQKDSIGGFKGLTLTYYWSSAEDDSNSAWNQDFNVGIQSSYYKTSTYGVRAVRAF